MKQKNLADLLAQSAALHRHLCPRQVLGVRMGLTAGELLGLDLPQVDKRLFVIVETDGCAADGISVSTNCWIGRRTLRVEDYGKVAATFVDTLTGAAVRLVPRHGCRQQARDYAPEASSLWKSQLLGYQRMPAVELFTYQFVVLKVRIEQLVSLPDKKTLCNLCEEEVINEREVYRNGMILCRSCAGESYYEGAAPEPFSRLSQTRVQARLG